MNCFEHSSNFQISCVELLSRLVHFQARHDHNVGHGTTATLWDCTIAFVSMKGKKESEGLDAMWTTVLKDEEEAPKKKWRRNTKKKTYQGSFDDGAESMLDTVLGEDLSDQLGDALDSLFMMPQEERQENEKKAATKESAYSSEEESSAPFDFMTFDARDQEEEPTRKKKKGWFRRGSSKKRVASMRN